MKAKEKVARLVWGNQAGHHGLTSERNTKQGRTSDWGLGEWAGQELKLD